VALVLVLLETVVVVLMDTVVAVLVDKDAAVVAELVVVVAVARHPLLHLKSLKVALVLETTVVTMIVVFLYLCHK
jgi:hypothetical protein